mmetsp:Transcript_149936/g.462863  ORF Transcript_149936/g.462863 Transcript_149936/m.462863 type:complete len:216 (+) Transcript_149936:649-1296(+)
MPCGVNQGTCVNVIQEGVHAEVPFATGAARVSRPFHLRLSVSDRNEVPTSLPRLLVALPVDRPPLRLGDRLQERHQGPACRPQQEVHVVPNGAAEGVAQEAPGHVHAARPLVQDNVDDLAEDDAGEAGHLPLPEDPVDHLLDARGHVDVASGHQQLGLLGRVWLHRVGQRCNQRDVRGHARLLDLRLRPTVVPSGRLPTYVHWRLCCVNLHCKRR